jgi:hypothetical protein
MALENWSMDYPLWLDQEIRFQYLTIFNCDKVMPAQVLPCRRSSSSLRLPGSPVRLVGSPPLLHTSSPQLCSGSPRLLLPAVTATPRVRVCWGLYKPPLPPAHRRGPPQSTSPPHCRSSSMDPAFRWETSWTYISELCDNSFTRPGKHERFRFYIFWL